MKSSEYAYEALQKTGLRKTKQRVAMLQMLDQSMYSAPEIYQKLQVTYPGVSLETIYSNIRSFLKVGLIGESEKKGITAYFLLKDEACHHRAVCVHCGKVVPLTFCPMTFVEKELQEVGVIIHHKLIIEMECFECYKLQNNENEGD